MNTQPMFQYSEATRLANPPGLADEYLSQIGLVAESNTSPFSGI